MREDINADDDVNTYRSNHVERCLGGIINALVSDNGFVKPSEETAGEVTIIRPGFAGNILLGAVAAFISWGLYRSLQQYGPVWNCHRNRYG